MQEHINKISSSFSIFIVYKRFIHWSTRTSRTVSCRLSFFHKLTTVMLCSQVYRPAHLLHCSECWMPLTALWLVLWRVPMSAALWSHYTGYQSPIRYDSNCPHSQRDQRNQSCIPVRHQYTDLVNAWSSSAPLCNDQRIRCPRMCFMLNLVQRKMFFIDRFCNFNQGNHLI